MKKHFGRSAFFVNKKWNIDSYPDDASIPRMYVQDVPNNVPATTIPQIMINVK